MRRKWFLVALLVLLLPLTMTLAQNTDTIVIRGFGNITTFNPR